MEEFIIKNNVLLKYNGKGGNVVIPDSVTEIGQFAFTGCSGLTSITIPNSVTEIGYGAFWDCKGLTSIVVAKGNGKYDSRDNCNAIIETTTDTLVNGCMNTVIPDSVTEIGQFAFTGCSGLTSIVIPETVTIIGKYAFKGCSGLTTVTIDNSVTVIGSSVFEDCSGLTSISIPDSVTEIGYSAFSGTNIKHNPKGNIAYKGFNADMTCRGFLYEEGKTYVCEEAKLCECGFHACLNPLDCFDYYSGENAVYHEVILEDRSDDVNDDDSKVCGRKITIGRRLTLKEMLQIFNELNK